MVTIKSVEPGDNCFSINHIISWISNFLRKSYVSQLCPHRPDILSLYFFQLVKLFLPTDKIFTRSSSKNNQTKTTDTNHESLGLTDLKSIR